jgi:mRNA-degrading endonuclease RelE of RelBE toxin-antitoxin system
VAIKQPCYGTLLAYIMHMEFVESPPFTRQVSRYLDEDAYRELQARLSENPEMGDLMPGTGGFRKMRWADARRGKGRRGGLRIVYYHFSSDHQIWLMILYGKDEVSDLTAQQRKALKVAIEQELAARAAKRRSRLRG